MREQLLSTVRHNCHIADARHAADYTLCTYLMKMRELYRWEHGYPLDQELDSNTVGEWVRQREAYWESLSEQEFRALPVNVDRVDPFDHDSVNECLLPHGLVYSSGLGRQAAAHFFLGELLEQKHCDGYTVLISGRELARDLVSPPAMTRGNVIFLRRESLKRLLWERVQEWRWNRCENPLGKALLHYGLDDDLEAGLESLVDDQMEMVLLHEIGEVNAGQEIESAWTSQLMSVAGSRAELQLRAIRDNLADAISTLPFLLANGRPELIHFYFATFGPMRRDLSPSIHAAYQQWCESGDLRVIATEVERLRAHWEQIMRQAMAIRGERPAARVTALIEGNRL
ncbi:MAG TPA: hypothetical protein ENJ35_09795 [Gammaproteobacteria bacterium]|nr:hypothetical protein [Gammaproteobacteria bacterium]